MGLTPKVIALVAGGTGGHFFPALALNEALRAKGYTTHVITDERTQFPESLTAQTPVFRMRLAQLNGVKGHLMCMVRGIWETLRLWQWMRKHKVQLVVGFGGYVSVPALLAGFLSGAKLMLHEQNAYVGRVARLFASLAVQITAGFLPLHGLAEKWKTKCVLTGNPVRSVFTDVQWHPQGVGVNLVILGGSQGARVMSHVVAPAVAALPEDIRSKLMVHHQARPEDVDAVQGRYVQAHIAAQVSSFFNNVPDLLAQADLVICRSGAATLSELACVGAPALLIPFPYAMDDHQTYNAKVMESKGAALVIKEDKIDENELAKTIASVINKESERRQMAQQMKTLGQPQAASQMMQVIEGLI
jgi:UDP-N-acetylglucosamine--N-acetylmuramyl-(pentapeptide) pyrophosphoryl-undecaprenol N-acetylglucosamine transferase